MFERGAKVLITSQHERHNNLTRHLGVSRSVVVDVGDFSLSEIEQFAIQLGCPAEDAEFFAHVVQYIQVDIRSLYTLDSIGYGRMTGNRI